MGKLDHLGSCRTCQRHLSRLGSDSDAFSGSCIGRSAGVEAIKRLLVREHET